MIDFESMRMAAEQYVPFLAASPAVADKAPVARILEGLIIAGVSGLVVLYGVSTRSDEKVQSMQLQLNVITTEVREARREMIMVHEIAQSMRDMNRRVESLEQKK